MTGTDAAPTISVQEVSKRFPDGVLAVDALNVTVGAGEIVCLLGGRRAGKSVVLRLVAGLLRPSYGTVRIGGHPVIDPLESLRRVTYIGSGTAHAPLLKPAENLQCYATLSGAPCSRERCVQALREVGLPESALTAAARTLSAEHRLMIWLAAASIRNNTAVLLDDPSAGLEPGAINRLQGWLRRRRVSGTPILLATSDPLLASQADKILFLVEGRKVSEKTRAEFTTQSLMGLYLESLGHQ